MIITQKTVRIKLVRISPIEHHRYQARQAVQIPMEVVKESGDEEQQQQTEAVDSKQLKQNDPSQCQCGYLYPANLPNDYCDICYYKPEDTKNHVCDCHCDACPRFHSRLCVPSSGGDCIAKVEPSETQIRGFQHDHGKVYMIVLNL